MKRCTRRSIMVTEVTTATLSKEQYAFTAQRIDTLGLQDQVTLSIKDYRDLTGQYDKLVSIEMIEAVGHRFCRLFQRLLRTCSRTMV